jgi:hypothetical protein
MRSSWGMSICTEALLKAGTVGAGGVEPPSSSVSGIPGGLRLPAVHYAEGGWPAALADRSCPLLSGMIRSDVAPLWPQARVQTLACCQGLGNFRMSTPPTMAKTAPTTRVQIPAPTEAAISSDSCLTPSMRCWTLR